MPGPHYYLAQTEQGSRALFSDRDEARRRLEDQARFHHPGQATRWIDGSDHGWEELRLPDDSPFGHVYTLWLNEHALNLRMYDYD